MEEYNRDSLRELRRMELEGRRKEMRKTKGSLLITLLIIALFLAAGGFYVKTSKPAWIEKYFNSVVVEQTLQDWKEDISAVFKPASDDVKETVDSALTGPDEAS